MNKLDADQIIMSIALDASRLFEGGEPRDRLSYQVGMLQGKIRELCYIIDLHEELILEIKQQLDSVK
jgi:hypothetical protein